LFPNQKKTIIWNANKNQYETNTGDKLKYLGYQTTISSTQRKRGFFTASKLLSGKIAEGKIFGNMVFDNKTCSFSQSDKKTIFFNPASMSFDEKLLYSQINTPLVVLYSVALVNALNTKNRLLQ
jgi:hypothetical protein